MSMKKRKKSLRKIIEAEKTGERMITETQLKEFLEHVCYLLDILIEKQEEHLAEIRTRKEQWAENNRCIVDY